jgi:hypothetical protein
MFRVWSIGPNNKRIYPAHPDTRVYIFHFGEGVSSRRKRKGLSIFEISLASKVASKVVPYLLFLRETNEIN